MKRYVFWVFVVLVLIAPGAGCGPSPEAIVLPPTGSVTGTILETTTNPPAPTRLPAARLILEDANNAPANGFLGPFFTNPSGQYLIPNIPPGTYDLVADKAVGTPPALTPLRARIRFIHVTAGNTTVLPDLIVRPPGTLAGTVLLAGAGPTGNAGITVFAEGTDRKTLTDATGAFTLKTALFPTEPPIDMEVSIGVHGQPAPYTLVFQKTGYIEEVRRNIEVVSGQTTTVTTTLQPLNPQSSASLAGRVVLEPRDPATGDASGTTVTVLGTSQMLVTTPGGFFRFEALPLSIYTLSFAHDNAFTRTVTNVRLVPGELVHNLGTLQLDTHRGIAPGVKAFDLVHSPNGTQVAYIDPNGELDVMDREGNVFHQVLTQGARAAFDARTGLGRGLHWSPDGTALLFVQRTGFASLPFSVATVPSAGGAVQTLLTSGNEYYQPAWAPDGGAVTYYLTPALHRVQVSHDSTGATSAVTPTDVVISGSNPPGVVTAFSGLEVGATGRVVYSFASTANSNGVFTAFALGGVNPVEVIPLLPPAAPKGESPVFSPDASRIAFSLKASDPSLRGIYLMNLDGSGPTRLTTQAGNNLDFSPTGERIIYTTPDIGSPHLGEVNEVLVPR